jgi:hypothetical protein
MHFINSGLGKGHGACDEHFESRWREKYDEEEKTHSRDFESCFYTQTPVAGIMNHGRCDFWTPTQRLQSSREKLVVLTTGATYQLSSLLLDRKNKRHGKCFLPIQSPHHRKLREFLERHIIESGPGLREENQKDIIARADASFYLKGQENPMGKGPEELSTENMRLIDPLFDRYIGGTVCDEEKKHKRSSRVETYTKLRLTKQ